MVYGYTCLNPGEGKRELSVQVKAIKKYARDLYESPNIILDALHIEVGIYQPEYKNGLQEMLSNVKEGDIVIFPMLDTIYPTNEGITGILTQLYHKRVNVVVLDFPIIEKVQFNPLLLNKPNAFMLYDFLIESMLDCREFLLEREPILYKQQ